jgi:hypothetical protein
VYTKQMYKLHAEILLWVVLPVARGKEKEMDLILCLTTHRACATLGNVIIFVQEVTRA